MTKFADQLFADLMLEHGSTLDRPRTAPARQRHPARVAGVVVGAAAAVTGGIVVFSPGSPAYALTDNPNGSVTLTVNKASGIAEANDAFAARHDRVVVVPVRAGCPDIGSFAAPADAGARSTASARGGEDPSAVTLDITGIPADRTALVGVDTSGGRTLMATVMIAGAAPECVSLPAGPPPGAVTETHDAGDGGAGLSTNAP